VRKGKKGGVTVQPLLSTYKKSIQVKKKEKGKKKVRTASNHCIETRIKREGKEERDICVSPRCREEEGEKKSRPPILLSK